MCVICRVDYNLIALIIANKIDYCKQGYTINLSIWITTIVRNYLKYKSHAYQDGH